MSRFVLSRCALLLCALVAALPALAQKTSPEPLLPRPLPPLILRAPEATQPIRLKAVKADVLIVGRQARTTLELAFFNPNARILEGELQFPLLAGQKVSAFALDIDGKWRPAVAVDKVQAQAVFEDVTRARIDPALLEATQGQYYKLRVYPIPAQGERKVSLTLVEQLPVGRDGAAHWRLPLAFGSKLDVFDFRLQAPGLKANALQWLRAPQGINVREEEGALRSEFHRHDYQPEALLSARLQLPASAQTSFEERDGKTYFLADLPLPKPAKTAPRPLLTTLALVWDASASGARRDHGREFAFLDAWFKAAGKATVQLTLARDVAEDGGRFAVVNGDWSALRSALEKVAYDGATSAAAFSPTLPAGLTLLFTDGLINYGAPALPKFTAPLLALSAVLGSDGERLRHAAEQSGGLYVDLLQTTPAAAVTAWRQGAPRLLALRSNGASELVAGAIDPESSRLSVAGLLNESATTLELEWTGGVRQQFTLQPHPAPTRAAKGAKDKRGAREARGDELGFAAQAWARLKLNTLLPEKSLNRGEIRRLGKAFGLATPGTSLLVLDRVEDYVRYDIVPPAELRAEYERLQGQRRQQLAQDSQRHLDDIARRFADKQRWWERDFPKGDKPKPKAAEKPLPPPQPVAAMALQESRAPQESMRMNAAASPPAPAPLAAAKTAVADGAGGAPTIAIQLKKWQPDAPYAERLRKASDAERYRIYLDERGDYLNSTAFYLDAADLFFARGQNALALRILSNLAEMDLENRHILRILAYRLSQAKRADLAVPVLRRVVELAPNEPQSWRDLGLALADLGQRQQAVEALYEVVKRPWHDRFPDIELVALAEMNAIVATAPEKLDLAAIDPRFIRNLPLDLRVVLAWDADNTDIDLWVTDPNGEKAFYGNRLTYQGGAMSRDFTGGYGPEEFSLKQAKPGKYLVQAQFYGHRQQVVAGATTLLLRLTTGFGTPAQKEERVTLRLKGQREVITVGEFVVGQ